MLLAAALYVGSQACKPCHEAQFAGHAKTGHARALARDKDRWAFGAGFQAVTYVSQLNQDYYLEHGLSWYRVTKSLALTPGHSSPAGERYRTFDPGAAILRCFQCHSTGPLRLTAELAIEPAEPGVQCEVCHGPASEHVAGDARMRKPDSALCGACHRMPAKAGDDTDWTNPWNVRHQPLFLARSKCAVKGGVTCLTCHVAHTSSVRSVCGDCHPAPKHRTALAGRTCVSCHMPAVSPHPNLKFANHWIGVYAPTNPLRPISR